MLGGDSARDSLKHSSSVYWKNNILHEQKTASDRRVVIEFIPENQTVMFQSPLQYLTLKVAFVCVCAPAWFSNHVPHQQHYKHSRSMFY